MTSKLNKWNKLFGEKEEPDNHVACSFCGINLSFGGMTNMATGKSYCNTCYQIEVKMGQVGSVL